MTTISKLTAEHLDTFHVDPNSQGYHEALVPFIRRTLDYPDKAHSLSVVQDGVVVAVGGVVVLWPGVSEAWIALGDTQWGKKNAKNLLVACRDVIHRMAVASRSRRIHCTVKVSSHVSQRFVEALGFEREGMMRFYGVDGSDCYQYVLFPEETE